ncbi:MAG TPA: ABC transporter permease [Candidatus Sulfotelmatobacter sp.]|nr:ABC transporter permease [Candidatus Sulfotelmatobacter sp.]
MTGLLQNLRYALRQLRKSPGFAAIAILTLALGIGCNSTIFSLVNAFLLRPLPYPEPDKLAVIIRHVEGTSPRSGEFVQDDDPTQDGKTWEEVRDQIPSVHAAVFGGTSGVNLVAGSRPSAEVRYVNDMRVSAQYFNVLGIAPILGRGFTQEEDRPNGPNAVILSYALWQSALHGDREIVGKPVTLKGEPYTVVGVLPRDVQVSAWGGRPDLWTPLQPHQSGECGGQNCEIIVRLAQGATWQQVAAELSRIRKDWLDEVAKENTRAWFYVSPLARNVDNGMGQPVLLLMVAVGLILLIACTNLAGLTLVRISRRTAELATRLALGATRWGILRQLWTEGLVLAVLGAAAGLLLAFFTLSVLRRVIPEEMMPLGGLAIDARVLAFTFAASVLASLLFAALPALQVRGLDLRSSIAAGSHTVVQGSSRLRRVLVSGEVALTIVLLAGAGLLTRTLIQLQSLPKGFDPTNVVTASLSLDDARYRNAAAFQNLLDRSVTEMRKIPGVEDAAVGLSLPYERGLNEGVKILDGKFAGKDDGSSMAYITPGYFNTLKIPVLAGRGIADTDTPSSLPVAVINSDFARQFFGEAFPIGRHIQTSDHTYTVVGVVENVAKKPGMGGDQPIATEPVLYLPAAQTPQGLINVAHVWFQPSWIVRTRQPLEGTPHAMQQALARVDAQLPFSGFHSMQQILAKSLVQQRIEVGLIATFAGLALLLSAIGIYGLVSNLIVQRRREFGIRIAFGSSIQAAMFDVGSDGVKAAVYGLFLGVLVSLFVLRVLRSVLYGIRYYDPITLVMVGCAILTIAVLASVLPALRLASLDPVETLRAE